MVKMYAVFKSCISETSIVCQKRQINFDLHFLTPIVLTFYFLDKLLKFHLKKLYDYLRWFKEFNTAKCERYVLL